VTIVIHDVMPMPMKRPRHTAPIVASPNHGDTAINSRPRSFRPKAPKQIHTRCRRGFTRA
jgi:hypothetical protein